MASPRQTDPMTFRVHLANHESPAQAIERMGVPVPSSAKLLLAILEFRATFLDVLSQVSEEIVLTRQRMPRAGLTILMSPLLAKAYRKLWREQTTGKERWRNTVWDHGGVPIVVDKSLDRFALRLRRNGVGEN